MDLNDYRKEQQDKYIIDNGLEQSYIDKKVLWQCRPLLPEVKIVGKDKNNNIVFFEETCGSLQKRHYGNSIKATSFNLVYFDGKKTNLITRNYLITTKINYNEGYDLPTLNKFLDNNNHRFNALNDEKRKRYSYNLTVEENEIVREFVKKMRMYK